MPGPGSMGSPICLVTPRSPRRRFTCIRTRLGWGCRGCGAQPSRAGRGDSVTTMGLDERLAAEEDCGEFPHVVGGVVLVGAAARLATMLDPGFLDEAGWDPTMRVLALPARHRLLGRTVCRAQGCRNIVQSGLTVCHRCFTRLTRLGMSRDEIAAAMELPGEPVSATRCAVSGCRCVPTVRHAVLCEPHAKKFRLRRPPMSMQQFLADPRVWPLPPMPTCQVAACIRPAE